MVGAAMNAPCDGTVATFCVAEGEPQAGPEREEDEERYDVAYPVEDAPEPEEVSRPSRGRREKDA